MADFVLCAREVRTSSDLDVVAGWIGSDRRMENAMHAAPAIAGRGLTVLVLSPFFSDAGPPDSDLFSSSYSFNH